MQDEKISLFGRLKKLKYKEYLLAGILGVIVLFVFFGQISNGSAAKDTNKNDFSPVEYAQSLEKKLEKVLSKMDGAGKTTVVVTVASGMQSIPYLKEDGTPLQSAGKVVLLKECYPEVVGVVIVCEGADSYLTKMQITGAACALLNISEDRVRVYPNAS